MTELSPEAQEQAVADFLKIMLLTHPALPFQHLNPRGAQMLTLVPDMVARMHGNGQNALQAAEIDVTVDVGGGGTMIVRAHRRGPEGAEREAVEVPLPEPDEAHPTTTIGTDGNTGIWFERPGHQGVLRDATSSGQLYINDPTGRLIVDGAITAGETVRVTDTGTVGTLNSDRLYARTVDTSRATSTAQQNLSPEVVGHLTRQAMGPMAAQDSRCGDLHGEAVCSMVHGHTGFHFSHHFGTTWGPEVPLPARRAMCDAIHPNTRTRCLRRMGHDGPHNTRIEESTLRWLSAQCEGLTIEGAQCSLPTGHRGLHGHTRPSVHPEVEDGE